MFCAKCNKDFRECTCEDLDERLRSLGNSLIYRMCKKCGKHYARCKCENPEWTTSQGDQFLPEEFKNKHIVEELKKERYQEKILEVLFRNEGQVDNVDEALSTLPITLQHVIVLRFSGHTLREVGTTIMNSKTKTMGISGNRVMQLEQKAIRMLHHPSRRKIIKGEMTAAEFKKAVEKKRKEGKIVYEKQ